MEVLLIIWIALVALFFTTIIVEFRQKDEESKRVKKVVEDKSKRKYTKKAK